MRRTRLLSQRFLSAGDGNLRCYGVQARDSSCQKIRFYEPPLHLADLDIDESVGARVRSALTEPLPGGASGMGDAAAKLGLSRRTLQRKLEAEHTMFQKQLNGTRELLAIRYIRNADMSVSEYRKTR